MNQKGSEHKDISDPSCHPGDLRVQLTGGGLRWLASILATAAAGLLAYFWITDQKPKFDFPVSVEGTTAWWVLGLAFVAWFALAVVNWMAWWRKRVG